MVPREYTENKSYSCNRCQSDYSNPEEAKACFDKGLPEILQFGTTYRRDYTNGNREYFLIEFRPPEEGLDSNHEMMYVVGAFPSTSLGAGYNLVYATASFDGKFLHTLEGLHSRGGLVSLGTTNAERISDSELQELLKDEVFRAAHERASSFGKRKHKK